MHVDKVTFGEFYLDVSEQQLKHKQNSVSLEPKTLDLLCYFVAHAEQLVSKQDLIDQVWHGRVVSDNAITRSVAQLRKALNDDSQCPAFIQTVPRKGYRWIAPIAAQSAAGSDTARLSATKPMTTHSSTLIEPRGDSVVQPSSDGPSPESARQRNHKFVWLTLLTVIAALLVAQFLPDSNTPEESKSIAIRPLTSLPGTAYHPAYSADGQYLAFSHQAPDALSQHIYVQHLDAHEPKQVSSGEHYDFYPSWSADGAFVVFTRWQTYANRECSIMRVDVATLETETLATCRLESSARAVLSANNGALYFVDRPAPRESFQLYQLNLRTSELKQISEVASGGYGMYHLQIHPQKDEILAVQADTRTSGFLTVYDASTGNPLRQHKLDMVPYRFAFTPWENQFVYHSRNEIRIYDATAQQSRLVYQTNRPVHTNMTFDPAHPRIAFVDTRSDANIYLQALNTRDDALVAITQTKRSDWAAVFDPSGQRMAFMSKRTGEPGLWLSDSALNVRHLKNVPENLNTNDIQWHEQRNGLMYVSAGNAYFSGLEQSYFETLLDIEADIIMARLHAHSPVLFYSAEKGDAAQIYKRNLMTGEEIQLTENGGVYFDIDDTRGSLYFTKKHEAGIWHRSLATTSDSAEVKVINDLSLADGRALQASTDGVYFYSRKRSPAGLYMQPADSDAQAQLVMPFTTGDKLDFAVDRQERSVLFSKVDSIESSVVEISLPVAD